MDNYHELIERLRNTPNWKREEFEEWKSVKTHFDRAPFEAADAIEALQARVSELQRQMTTRDEYILGRGEWSDFVKSLP